MRKIRLEALPSGAPQSTPPGAVMTDSPGRRTAALLAWGTAMPEPMAVELCASRSIRSCRNWAGLERLPWTDWRETSSSTAAALSAGAAPSRIPWA